MTSPTTAATLPPRTVTLGDLAGIVGDLRWFWLGGAAIGLAIAVAASVMMRPTYRASITVMPVADSRQIAGAIPGLLARFGGGASLGLGDQSSRDESIAVLKSRQFTQQLIADEVLLPVLFADQWDAKEQRWREMPPERIPTSWDGWQYFDRKIRNIREDRDRGLITIDIEWADPGLAARWANLLVERANEELRQRRLEQLEKSLAMLGEELQSAQLVELRQAIASVIESQVNERMLAKTRREFAFRVIDPAQPPDADQPESPRPWFYAAIGMTLGALGGLAWGLLRRYAAGHRPPSTG